MLLHLIRASSALLIPTALALGATACTCAESHTTQSDAEPSDGSDETDGRPGDAASLSDASRDEAIAALAFLEEYAVAICEGLSHCVGGQQWESVELCARENPLVSPYPEPSVRFVPWGAEDLVREGVLRFDAGAARSCLEETRTACVLLLQGLEQWTLRDPSSCDAVFSATRARDDGEPCTYSFECAPTSHCTPSPSFACGWEPRCSPRLADDAHCYLDDQCRRDSDCVPTLTGATCKPVIARLARGMEGDPCGWLPDETLPTRLVRITCEDDLTCIGEFGSPTGECRVPIASGEPCDRSLSPTQCAGYGECNGDGLCESFPIRATNLDVEPGDPCPSSHRSTSLLGFCSVSRELLCSDGGVCVAWEDGAAMTPCSVIGAPCEPGYFCLNGNGVCVLALGEMGCFNNDTCASACCVDGMCI